MLKFILQLALTLIVFVLLANVFGLFLIVFSNPFMFAVLFGVIAFVAIRIAVRS